MLNLNLSILVYDFRSFMLALPKVQLTAHFTQICMRYLRGGESSLFVFAIKPIPNIIIGGSFLDLAFIHFRDSLRLFNVHNITSL
jgi:hypothetical protein